MGTENTTNTDVAEKWRAVPGTNGVYSVSNHGRVQLNVSRHNKKAGSLLRQSLDSYGYPIVSTSILGTQESKRTITVHRLVALAFLGPKPPGLQVNHINGSKTDNRPENLEYVTPLENIHHAMRVLGRRDDGEYNNAAKLTEETVATIRKRHSAGEPMKILASEYGVTKRCIGLVVTGRTWPNVPGPTRSAKEHMGPSCLTDQQVAEIRNRARAGEQLSTLATEFGVSITSVRNYRDGKVRHDAI